MSGAPLIDLESSFTLNSTLSNNEVKMPPVVVPQEWLVPPQIGENPFDTVCQIVEAAHDPFDRVLVEATTYTQDRAEDKLLSANSFTSPPNEPETSIHFEDNELESSFLTSIMKCRSDDEVIAKANERIRFIRERTLKEMAERDIERGLRRRSMSLINIPEVSDFELSSSSSVLNTAFKCSQTTLEEEPRLGMLRRCSEPELNKTRTLEQKPVIADASYTVASPSHPFITEEIIHKFRQFRASIGSLTSSSDDSSASKYTHGLNLTVDVIKDVDGFELEDVIHLSALDPVWDSPVPSDSESDECALPSVSRQYSIRNNNSFTISDETITRYRRIRASICEDDVPTVTPVLDAHPVPAQPQIPSSTATSDLKLKSANEALTKKGPLKAVIPIQQMTKVDQSLKPKTSDILVSQRPLASSTPDRADKPHPGITSIVDSRKSRSTLRSENGRRSTSENRPSITLPSPLTPVNGNKSRLNCKSNLPAFAGSKLAPRLATKRLTAAKEKENSLLMPHKSISTMRRF